MIKGIIFDLDGVLVSSDRFHYAARKAIADREGIYCDPQINLRLRGVGRMDCVDILLERATRSYTQAEKIQLAEDKNRRYVASLSAQTPRADSSISQLEELLPILVKLACPDLME